MRPDDIHTRPVVVELVQSTIVVLPIAAESLVTSVSVLAVGRELVVMAIGIVIVGSELEIGDVHLVGLLGEHTEAAGCPGVVGVEALVHHVAIGGVIDKIVHVAP